jgi:eukaryotic-like serine/threonine-protein kinase
MSYRGDFETTVSLRRHPAPSAPEDERVPVRLGDFELAGFLGGGGMGIVFEARHVVLDRRVAIKVLRRAHMQSDEARARLLREAQAMARIKHPNVVTLFEVGAAGEDVFIAMELVEGGTLREWMQRPHDWRAVVDLFLAFGRGLVAVHDAGLVHRDVNPSNVLIDRDGTPKLGDFGLVYTGALDAHHDGVERWLEPRLTAQGSVVGTPAYMAPEQRRHGRVDARADQFAFCLSLAEAITGRLPIEGTPPRPIPRPLRPILARGLAAVPDTRFPSLRHLLAALAIAAR